MLLIFNDIAGSEILLILVFVLIFFGSKSIPSLAKTMGRTIRQIKDASADIQNEIKKSSEEMKKDLNLTGIMQETAEDIKRPLDQLAIDIDNSVKYQPPNRNSHIKPAEIQMEIPAEIPTAESMEHKVDPEDQNETVDVVKKDTSSKDDLGDKS